MIKYLIDTDWKWLMVFYCKTGVPAQDARAANEVMCNNNNNRRYQLYLLQTCRDKRNTASCQNTEQISSLNVCGKNKDTQQKTRNPGFHVNLSACFSFFASTVKGRQTQREFYLLPLLGFLLFLKKFEAEKCFRKQNQGVYVCVM